MEVSHEVLDTIDVDNDKDVMEVLKQAITEEDIIIESEATEDSVETEIEEIIEIIEEIEEDNDELMGDNISFTESKSISDKGSKNIAERLENEQFNKNSDMEVYAFDEENSIFKTHLEKECEETNLYHKSNVKQVIAYDVDEDWQDEEMDESEEYNLKFDQSSDISDHETESLQEQRILSGNDKKYVNNEILSLQSSKSELRDSIESMDKVGKSKLSQDYKHNANSDENIDNNVNHEIVKNVENNLLYTVLGTKKQNSAKILQEDKLSNAHYIKVYTITLLYFVNYNIPICTELYMNSCNILDGTAG